jgi:hypothetical protein
MLTPLSATAQAQRDTLLTRADTWAFRRIASMYGLPAAPGFPVDGWRAGLQEAALGPRGAMANMLDVLEGLFSWADQVFSVTMDFGPRAVLGAGVWGLEHGLRLLRIRGAGFDQRRFSARSIGSPNLALADQATSYWEGGTVLGPAELRVLPFLVEERAPCEFRVLLDATIFRSPPTYVLADGTVDRVVAYPGQPYGGHVLENAALVGSQADGPFPIYLPGGDFPGELQRTLDSLLASGCSLVIVPHTFTS